MIIISVQVDQAARQAPRLLLPDPELQLNMGELPSRVDLSQWPPMAGGVKDQGFVTLGQEGIRQIQIPHWSSETL